MKQSITAKIVNRQEIAANTFQIDFQLDSNFNFKAGQYVWVIIPALKYPDPRGNRRAFSICSDPSNSYQISIIFRSSNSGFKKTLIESEIGTEVNILGPRGNFVLPQNIENKNLVCLAGGTGLSPFISMAYDLTSTSQNIEFNVISYNLTEEREFLQDHFKKLSSLNSHIHFRSIIGKPTLENMSEYLNTDSQKETLWFLSGSPDFVLECGKLLLNNKVNLSSIVCEECVFNPTKLTSILPEANKILDFNLGIESSSNHIIFTDPDGYILYANSAAQLITGYSFEEMKNHTPRLWGGLMDPGFYQNMWHKIKVEKIPFKGEITNIKKNGQIYTAIARISPILDNDKNLLGFVGTEEDITELIETTNQLKQSRDIIIHQRVRDEAILKNIGEALVVTDELGNITLVNKSFERITGYLDQEVIGKNMLDVLPKYDEKNQLLPKNIRSLTKILNGESLQLSKSSLSNTHYYAKKDGTRFPMKGIVTPINIDGKLIGAIQIFQDITREKEIDTMKSDFCSLASHQLRTPLTAIRWNLELLKTTGTDNLTTDQSDIISRTYQTTLNMIELVNTLLNISRIESGRLAVNPQMTNLKKLIEDLLLLLRPAATDKNQTIELIFDESIDEIMLDNALIRNVYLNLVTNSLKYSPNNGKVIIKVEKHDNQIISSVSDNGVGIPKNQFDNIFTKFFRATNVTLLPGGGTGLGLYLVKTIINSASGKIWFESEENKGTTFYFSLPIAGMEKVKGEVTIQS